MITRALNTRLAKLEERAGAREGERRPVHLISAYSDAEQAEKIAAVIESGAAQESDMLIVLTPLTRSAGE